MKSATPADSESEVSSEPYAGVRSCAAWVLSVSTWKLVNDGDELAAAVSQTRDLSSLRDEATSVAMLSVC